MLQNSFLGVSRVASNLSGSLHSGATFASLAWQSSDVLEKPVINTQSSPKIDKVINVYIMNGCNQWFPRGKENFLSHLWHPSRFTKFKQNNDSLGFTCHIWWTNLSTYETQKCQIYEQGLYASTSHGDINDDWWKASKTKARGQAMIPCSVPEMRGIPSTQYQVKTARWIGWWTIVIRAQRYRINSCAITMWPSDSMNHRGLPYKNECGEGCCISRYLLVLDPIGETSY